MYDLHMYDMCVKGVLYVWFVYVCIRRMSHMYEIWNLISSPGVHPPKKREGGVTVGDPCKLLQTSVNANSIYTPFPHPSQRWPYVIHLYCLRRFVGSYTPVGEYCFLIDRGHSYHDTDSLRLNLWWVSDSFVTEVHLLQFTTLPIKIHSWTNPIPHGFIDHFIPKTYTGSSTKVRSIVNLVMTHFF